MCGTDQITPFKSSWRAVKQLQACLSARKDRESSFLHCGSPGRLVQDCLCARNPDKSVLTSEEMQ